ncbi:MAG: hypothetical protein AB7K08_11435 [Microbacteriaceae bacterium]
MAETLQGTAVIIASKRDPGVDANWSESFRDDGLLNQLLVGVTGMPYEFALEVTVSGHEPYQVPGVRTRVPAKAEKYGLFEEHPIPLTLEVPVVVVAGAAERVAIDWKAFLAYPDRVARLKAARARALTIAAQRHREAMIAKDPSLAPSPDAQNPAMAWANAVRAGSLTRQQFDESCARLLALGQLSNADYLAAEARITEP